jgi:hypothetical protein
VVRLSILAALAIFNVVLSSALQDALFLQFHDRQQIPLVMLGASLLTAGVTLAVRRLMFRPGFSAPMALRLILVGLSGLMAALAAWNFDPGPRSTFALFLGAELATTLGVAAVWSYFQAPLDAAGLRRVLPRLGAWAGVGGLCAGILIPAVNMPPQNLLPLSAIAWLLAAVLVVTTHVPLHRAGRRTHMTGLGRLPLVRWMALSAAGSAWLTLLIQFNNRMALQHSLSPSRIASFMAVLLAISSVVGIAVQALAATWVLERWGVSVALAILPLALLALLGSYWWLPILPFIAAALFSDKTLRPNLARPAETCLQGALPPEMRSAAALTIAGVVAPLLKAVGALALVFAADVPQKWLLSAAVTLSLGLMALSLRWGTIYARALERTLAEGTVGGGDDEPLVPFIDGPRLSILLSVVDSGKHHARELALELLRPHREGIVRKEMRARVDAPDEAVRTLALRWFAAQSDDELESLVRARFARPETSDAERVALLGATRSPALLLCDNLPHWLSAPDLELRSVVVRALHAETEWREQAVGEVEKLLDAEAVPERVVGLQLARDLGLSPSLPKVRAALEHSDLAVVREALPTLAALDPEHAFSALTAALRQPRLASAATRALASLGPRAVPECRERLESAPHRSPLRKSLIRALGLLGSDEAATILLDELDGPDPAERLEAVKSLRLVWREGASAAARERLPVYIRRELGRGLALLKAQELLAPELVPGALSQRELAAQVAGARERVSRALTLLAPPGTMARIFWALRTPGSPHRDQARELLRTLMGAGPLLDATLKLLDEASPWPTLGDLATPLTNPADAWRWLASLDDPWMLSALSHESRPTPPLTEDPMQASLDTILFLKDVSLFAALTNPQLTEVARLAESAELARGKPLFMAGDTVDYFYIVRAGMLRVIKGGTEVARIGPGEPVGEMAVLAGIERTATIEAVENTRFLRFDAEDFLALIETYPEIGRALMRALVRRLAAQTRPVHPPRPQ